MAEFKKAPKRDSGNRDRLNSRAESLKKAVTSGRYDHVHIKALSSGIAFNMRQRARDEASDKRQARARSVRKGIKVNRRGTK